MFSGLTWETCAVTEAEAAVSAIRADAKFDDKALAMADLIQSAVTILQKGGTLTMGYFPRPELTCRRFVVYGVIYSRDK